MDKRRLLLWTIVFLSLIVLVGNALAMRSNSYWLDWFIPLTSGGGGSANSANNSTNFSVGQTSLGEASSENYTIGLGYWFGTAGEYKIYLPLVIK